MILADKIRNLVGELKALGVFPTAFEVSGQTVLALESEALAISPPIVSRDMGLDLLSIPPGQKTLCGVKVKILERSTTR